MKELLYGEWRGGRLQSQPARQVESIGAEVSIKAEEEAPTLP
jgi:hypothetical protein